MLLCERDDAVPTGRGSGAWHHDYAAVRRTRDRIDGTLDLSDVAHAGGDQINPECRRCGRDRGQVTG
jgi:hypothetical protein